MQPRLKTSKMSTDLPKDLLGQIKEIFVETFSDHLKKNQVITEGRIYPNEVLLRIGATQGKQLKQINFLVSMDYKQGKDQVMNLVQVGVDVLATLFDDYFANQDDADLPRQWTEINADGKKVHILYSTVNDELESEADRLLGIEKAESFVKEHEGFDEDDEDEALLAEIKQKLGIADDDDDEVHEDLDEDHDDDDMDDEDLDDDGSDDEEDEKPAKRPTPSKAKSAETGKKPAPAGRAGPSSKKGRH